MILKDAYRYMNYLDDLYGKARDILLNVNFITNTTQFHNKEKSNKDATNETIVVKKDETDYDTSDVINFAIKVISEKEKLAKAISEAKKKTPMDIDYAVSMNKKKQSFVQVLQLMANIKSTETEKTGTDYMINPIEGNQVTYKYPVTEIVTIDFDRNDVKKLIKKYSKECDEVSTLLDSLEITTIVEHEPLYDVNDSFEDVVLL